MNQPKTITPHRLAELDAQGTIEVIDVRTPMEFRAVHAVMARNVPLDQLDPCRLMRERGDSAEKPLYVICKSGGRGAKAQQKFEQAGFHQVVNVEGGTDAWVSAGLPVVRGKRAISLDRQVRMVIGALAAIGGLATLLTGETVWALLPAVLGVGLFLAGLTDSCVLGMILARMPWNQDRGTGGGCCNAG